MLCTLNRRIFFIAALSNSIILHIYIIIPQLPFNIVIYNCSLVYKITFYVNMYFNMDASNTVSLESPVLSGSA